MKGKIVLVLSLLLMVQAFGTVGIAQVEEAGENFSDMLGDVLREVDFPDEALKEAVQKTLNDIPGNHHNIMDSTTQMPSLMPGSLEVITSLTVLDAGISDLTGIESLVNLEYLILDNNQIVDVTPLAQLKNLRFLSLHGNKIVDLSPLDDVIAAGCRVALDENPIATSTPTPTPTPIPEPYEFVDSAIERIICAQLGWPEFVYESDLKRIREITVQEAQDKGIRYLDDLAYCTNLIVLNITDNMVSDLSPLSKLYSLEKLSIKNNNVTDLSPLRDLTKLRHLTVEGNPGISDISVTYNMSSLTWFQFHKNDTKIRDADVEKLMEVNPTVAVREVKRKDYWNNRYGRTPPKD